MRVRVVSNRVSKQVKEQRKKGGFKRVGAVFVNLTGHILLKDLGSESYMAMRFYKRFKLESKKYRLIDLVRIKSGREERISKMKQYLSSYNANLNSAQADNEDLKEQKETSK